MELYTREQMIEAFQYGKTLKGFDWIGDMIDSLTPIEIPSNEDVLNVKLSGMSESEKLCFQLGAKWVIEQIKN